jgi:hypothetical protein
MMFEGFGRTAGSLFKTYWAIRMLRILEVAKRLEMQAFRRARCA